MIFAPHILQMKSIPTSTVDENGDPTQVSFTWVTVCMCRCDDNTTKEFKDEVGHVYRPSYHIIYEGEPIKAGTDIRCLNPDGSIRGEGKVYLPKKTNYFNYSELWV